MKTNTVTITALENDDLDRALDAAITADDEELVDALFAERTSRIDAALAARNDGEVELDDEELVRVRKLSPLQVDRLEDEAGLVTTEDGVEGGFDWTAGRTYFEGPRELVEALYSRVDGSEALADNFNAETEAQDAMVHRAAIVSRESLAGKLAAALGDRAAANRHRFEARRVAKLSVYRVLDEQ